jgi:hypothetical protein
MINLRIVGKQMNRSSKKCEKNEKLALEKLKKVSHVIYEYDFNVRIYLHCVRASLNIRILVHTGHSAGKS